MDEFKKTVDNEKILTVLQDPDSTPEELEELIVEHEFSDNQLFLLLSHKRTNVDVIETLYSEYSYDEGVVSRILGSYGMVKASDNVIADIISNLSTNRCMWPRENWRFIHSAICAIIECEQLADYYYVKDFTYKKANKKHKQEDKAFMDDCSWDDFYDEEE